MFVAKRVGNLQETQPVLNCRRLPGRLNMAETAVLLGFQEHDIAALILGKLLAPLGKPAPNSPKYFASVDVLNAAQDRDWLSQVRRRMNLDAMAVLFPNGVGKFPFGKLISLRLGHTWPGNWGTRLFWAGRRAEFQRGAGR
jgi:hypothetical protein